MILEAHVLLEVVSVVLTAEVPVEVPVSALAVVLPEVLLVLEFEVVASESEPVFESESELVSWSWDWLLALVESVAVPPITALEFDESVLLVLLLAGVLSVLLADSVALLLAGVLSVLLAPC